MITSLDRAKQLIALKSLEDAPNYRKVGDASLQRCGTCRHFTDSGRCDLYDFRADALYTCDSWRPSIERLKLAREATETVKEVSSTPATTYAHGPGGLLSPAGMGGGKRKAAETPMKSEGDGKHPAGHYLVVEDADSPGTWHLRVRNTAGEVDRRLMGAAWAALTVGYRGNKYAGPNKREALVKLRALYRQIDATPPGETEKAVTTKPGDKYRSIKNPKVYEALIRKGMPKAAAAAISNAMAKRGKKGRTEKEKFDKASTQLDMPNVIKGKALQLARSIDTSDLHEYGIERDTHVTVKYGIANNTLDRVKQIASRFGPIPLKFGRVSLFKRPEEGFDVVKVGVESPELRALNKAISALPNADTRKGYNPHLTIAYVKAGRGEKYIGNSPLTGETVVIDTIQFSDKDGNKTAVKLAGKAQAETTKHVSHDQKAHGARHGVGGLREFAKKRGYSIRDRGEGAKNGRFEMRGGPSWRKDNMRANNLTSAKKLLRAANRDNIKSDRELAKRRRGGFEKGQIIMPKQGNKAGTNRAFRGRIVRFEGNNIIYRPLNARPGSFADNEFFIPISDAMLSAEKEWHTETQSTTATDRLQKARELAGRATLTTVTAAAVTTTKQTAGTPARNIAQQEKNLPTFTVFKDKSGRYRWVAISSTAYRDRDGEIVSTKALADDVARADETGQYGPLRWWHVPGLDLGDTDFNMLHGRSLVESGTFKNDRIAEKVRENARNLRLSLGFRHPADEPDKAGVFHNIRRFERSLIPPEGNASNLFTSLNVF